MKTYPSALAAFALLAAGLMQTPLAFAHSTLSVRVSGDGDGAVSSQPSGIHCRAGCSTAFASGATVTLTATPDHLGSVFIGWSGACEGTASTCTVTMNAAKSVEAVFANLAETVQAIGAGYDYTCALTSAGAAWCWGINGDGQLGGGTHGIELAPVPVSGLSSGVQAISARNVHTCALTSNGAALCWGYNGSGQLGDGTTTLRRTPVAVSGLSSGVREISSGDDHTCAVTNAGAVLCWGDNHYGQLGDGTTTSHLTPTAVPSLSSGVKSVVAGTWYTCAMTFSGAIWCWGYNHNGQLGDGTVTDRLAPVLVSNFSSGAQAISAGGFHMCALTSGGAVRCWGWNDRGQLGDGTTTDRWTPVTVTGFSSGAQTISAGRYHTCASTGVAWCWGSNGGGQLGDGTMTNRPTRVMVSNLSAVQAISAGFGHTCAVNAGAAWCWGDNYNGALGDGTMDDHATPAPVLDLRPDLIFRNGFE